MGNNKEVANLSLLQPLQEKYLPIKKSLIWIVVTMSGISTLFRQK